MFLFGARVLRAAGCVSHLPLELLDFVLELAGVTLCSVLSD
jgi:hypothetical protein